MSGQAGKVLNLKDIQIYPDKLGVDIARKWHEWNTLRANQMKEWEEIRRYVFATDTTTTTNSKLPWKNKTTMPKMCQIRDNLHANYMAIHFPKRKFLSWEADTKDSNSLEKRQCILPYMSWVCRQPTYKNTISNTLYDYIDTGNSFVMPEWIDQRIQLEDKQQVGYVGPALRRISPYDIVFNPISPSFYASPKIIRTLITMGELKEMLTRMSTSDNQEEMQATFDYLKNIRVQARAVGSEINVQDNFLMVDGFTSYRSYLESDYCEILTMYGDIYDYANDVFLRNHVCTVVDRHKLVGKRPNPSYFGYPPIFHVGWRKRQDNLWAMGPLANLVGLQYRIDHIENMKADILDVIGFPMTKIKGYVEDFDYGPMERVYCGEEGDVEFMMPPYQALQLNSDVQYYVQNMEEMAGSPKEAMGFRTPGEKTAYEVQRQENAAGRIFNSKASQFEELLIEPSLNGMLELARRNMSSVQAIPVINDEFNNTTFLSLTPQDITGAGTIKPIAARHFAEKSELVQNLTNFSNSELYKDQGVQMHFSGLTIAKIMEDALELSDYKVVIPYVRLSEEADAKRMAQQNQENTQMEAQTPSGIKPDDYDPEVDQQFASQMGQMQQRTQ